MKASLSDSISDGTTKPKLVVILGPTAVGKSDLAVELAWRFNGEVVSADSRQVYKGLDIGSGKITKKEMKGIPHHCLDIVSPKKAFTVSMFQEAADKAIEDIISRGKLPILCGGTGFYIDAVTNGIVLPDVPVNQSLRKKLHALTEEKLMTMLKKLDPKRAVEIHPNNKIRIIRAIEIAKELGSVPPVTRNEKYDALVIGLDTDDSILREKILKRIHARLRKGMVTEAAKLHEGGLSWKRMTELGLEYGLLAELIQGRLTRETFIERLNYDIIHYVRRQRQWFRYNKSVQWLDPSRSEAIMTALSLVKAFI